MPTTGWNGTFDLRQTELDFRGELSVLGVARLFQEAAWTHADALGFGPRDLRTRGVGWVLARFQLRLLAAKAPDSLRVQTWRTGFLRGFALRDFRAFDATGETLAEGTSVWAMFDLEARKSVPITEELRASYPIELPRVTLEALRWSSDSEGQDSLSFDPPGSASTPPVFVAQLSDLDENRHVTNTAFAAWVLNSVPPELGLRYRCRELSLVFRAEAFLGDEVRAQLELQRESGDGRVRALHRLSRVGDCELTSAITRWEEVP